MVTDVAMLEWGYARIQVSFNPPEGLAFAAPIEIVDTMVEGAIVETNRQEMLEYAGETVESLQEQERSLERRLGLRDGGASEGYAAWLTGGDEKEFDEERMRERDDILQKYWRWYGKLRMETNNEKTQSVELLVNTCGGSAYITVDIVAFLKRECLDVNFGDRKQERSLAQILNEDSKMAIITPFSKKGERRSVLEQKLGYSIPNNVVICDNVQVSAMRVV